MKINENNIYNNLKEFSFPRLSGTEDEEKAIELAKTKISEMDLRPATQQFHFSTFYSRVYPKIVFPLSVWILLVLYLNFNYIFVISALAITALLFLPFFILTRKPEKIKIGKTFTSQNIYVKLKPPSENNGNGIHSNSIKHIFFIAHIDSKGQRFTARIRFLSIAFYAISLILNSILLILRSFFQGFLYELFTNIGIFPFLITFISAMILTLNTTNNKSKGVVDDASGIACVLELLNYFRNPNNRPSDIFLWFVFTGAEESGTMGIRNFYDIIKDIDEEYSIVNNFESLGKSVAIFISKNNLDNNPKFYNLFEQKAAKYHFRTQVSSVNRGVHTDGIYLFRKSFNLFEFGSTDVGKYMHSEFDSLENVDPSILRNLCAFLIELISDYKSNYENFK